MNPEELAFAGIARQAELIAAGEVSSRQLVDLYLERIERLNPQLNAFVAVFDDQARADADAADQRIAAGERAPLLGVPVALKDEVDVAGQVSGHGTLGWDQPAEEDSAHWRRLREAGAILIGRTTLPELAICGFTETEAFGITRNPWDLNRTPGGSSGGSAAAVAAGLVGAASASDGAGSIRIPATNCGLFGLKPQRGRISLAPEAEHWHGLSVTGCVTRRVIDTALWLDVAAGADPIDTATPPDPERPYVESARSAPGNLRIAWSVKPVRAVAPPRVTDEISSAVEAMAAVLERLGHSVKQQDPDWGQISNGITPRYLKGISDQFATVPHPERLESRTRGFARMGRLIPRTALRSARRAEARDSARLNALFDDYDVLVTPVVGERAVEIGRWAGKGALRTLLGMSRTYPFAVPWNHTGQPAASVPAPPAGAGVPLSVQLVVPPGREDLLLSLGAQLEAELGWPEHRPPGFS